MAGAGAPGRGGGISASQVFPWPLAVTRLANMGFTRSGLLGLDLGLT
jgi:hypothetical protein